MTLTIVAPEEDADTHGHNSHDIEDDALVSCLPDVGHLA